MNNIRFLTSGESHGKALTGIIEGIPSGFSLSEKDVDQDLKRRQGGYGRGGRMKIESDHAEILSGVRWGKTTGAPIALQIENMDWENWQEGMSISAEQEGTIHAVIRPRPGHADLAGAIKYNTTDIRNILERSSARETAMRVGLGAVAKRVLSEFGIFFGSYVRQIGTVADNKNISSSSNKELLAAFRRAEKSVVRCPNNEISEKMVKAVDKAIKNGNSLGGIFELFVIGAPVGLGSHIQWDRKLDGRLAQSLMSIQAIKGVEIGLGFRMAGQYGSEVGDQIFYMRSGNESSGMNFYRRTNNAGGIEGGMSNGMPIIMSAVMKPIPTLRRPLRSIDVITKKPASAAYERSDVCAVPAAAVVGEAMAALTIADAFFEKFGGDSREETLRNYKSYASYIRKF